MKILAFAQYGSMQGGSNRSLLMVLENLKTMYHYEIQAVMPERGELTEALEKRNIVCHIVPSHEIGGVENFSPINIFRYFRFRIWADQDRKTGREFAEALKNEHFDLVYINDTNTYLGCYAAEALGIPYVWHFRSLIAPETIYTPESRLVFRNAGRMIAISEEMRKKAAANPAIPEDRITMIHNGIPLPPPGCVSPQSRSKGFHIVQCGRLTKDKGHMDAICALGILHKKGIQDIILHIAGDYAGCAEYVNKLKRLISDLRLESQVVFEGQCRDMLSFRKQMNCELMCSYCEPFGRVTIEGMRSGLVVIGSNTGGTAEIITDKFNGLLYEQGDPQSLAEKIEQVYLDPELCSQLISNALVSSADHFTPAENVRAIDAAMRSAVEDRKYRREYGIH